MSQTVSAAEKSVGFFSSAVICFHHFFRAASFQSVVGVKKDRGHPGGVDPNLPRLPSPPPPKPTQQWVAPKRKTYMIEPYNILFGFVAPSSDSLGKLRSVNSTRMFTELFWFQF